MIRLLTEGIIFPIRTIQRRRDVPAYARESARIDREGLPPADPGPERVVEEGMAWLARAHEAALGHGGGIARCFSLISGWSAPYPETTGYIVPTVIEHWHRTNDPEWRVLARRLLDWLVSIQMPDGAFQGGMIGQEPVQPVVFNTGQILIGLAAGVREFGEAYLTPMRRAADWLCEVQDRDGAWRRFYSSFAAPGEKAYDTHVAWGLLEAHRVDPYRGYADAALANIDWATQTLLRPNGWYDRCHLSVPERPLTHTLAYALRGVIEGYLYQRDPRLLDAALLTARGMLSALRPDGYLPGRLDSEWRPATSSACLTGTSQAACCWFILYHETGDPQFLRGALAANHFVRRTIALEGPPEVRGGVKGSFPVDGDYGRFEFLNWACKFTVDANVQEMSLRRAAVPVGAMRSREIA